MGDVEVPEWAQLVAMKSGASLEIRRHPLFGEHLLMTVTAHGYRINGAMTVRGGDETLALVASIIRLRERLEHHVSGRVLRSIEWSTGHAS